VSGTELDRVARLAACFGGEHAGVRLGIGDDAAVLDPNAAPLVWTVDAQVEGTHFRRAWVSFADVGFRSFMAAASDLAAMGATPLAALSSLCLADDVDDAALDALTRGQSEAARAVGAAVVGGNLARGRETSITTTLLGTAARPISRASARPGDLVLLAGAVGEAAAGLGLLERGPTDTGDPNAAACLRAWRRPRARIDDGQVMSASASAAIDVSDGLARDAHHVAAASSVVLLLDEHALRAHASAALVTVAAQLGRDPLDLALFGGEDYALVVTSPSEIEGFTRIGEVEAGVPGLVLRRADGSRVPLEPRGFDHFG
jgi:thiamine-monophosphate kinase